MSPVFLGALAALAWGTHDFGARFAGLRIGVLMTLFCVTLAGFIGLTGYLLVTDTSFPAPQLENLWLIVIMGAGLTLATLWLYEAVIRGPFSLVSPVVGAYPVTALLFFVAIGTRPSSLQWMAIAAVVAGVLIVAASSSDDEESGTNENSEVISSDNAITSLTPAEYRSVIFFATLAHLAFAVSITAGQFAAPLYGELEATWLSRVVSLALITAVLIGRSGWRKVPVRWTPVVAGMGLLDVTALAAVSAAGNAPGAELATVMSSTFGIVAILLARIFLREPITARQCAGIVCVFAGTAFLAL